MFFQRKYQMLLALAVLVGFFSNQASALVPERITGIDPEYVSVSCSEGNLFVNFNGHEVVAFGYSGVSKQYVTRRCLAIKLKLDDKIAVLKADKKYFSVPVDWDGSAEDILEQDVPEGVKKTRAEIEKRTNNRAAFQCVYNQWTRKVVKVAGCAANTELNFIEVNCWDDMGGSIKTKVMCDNVNYEKGALACYMQNLSYSLDQPVGSAIEETSNPTKEAK